MPPRVERVGISPICLPADPNFYVLSPRFKVFKLLGRAARLLHAELSSCNHYFGRAADRPYEQKEFRGNSFYTPREMPLGAMGAERAENSDVRADITVVP